jgi:DNA polymerase-1
VYLDWRNLNRDVYCIDIETESLTPSVIWVMCWMSCKTGEKGEETSLEGITEFFRRTAGSLYVGHNTLKFDAPVLVRLAGVNLSVSNCIDTLVLSTLYSPSLVGGHSLGAWGERLGQSKIEFDDFSKLTPEMVEYCHRDVSITCELFKRLIKTLTAIGFSEKSIWIQHRLTVIIDRQSRNGFYFDGPRAIDFYRMLRSREEELQDEIRLAFPATRTLVSERTMYKKDGSPTTIYLRDQERYIIETSDVGGRYRAFEDVEFSIGSPKQRTEKLLELGWEPQEFTPKTSKGGGGNPKPFEHGELSPSLEKFLEERPTPEVHLIAKWMAINGRANMINNWLENWNEDDGCIHGKLFTADTLRFRHQAPNTANIPAVRLGKDGKALMGESGYFTYEARDLWCARPGRILVGTDAAGLELRMLAHYLNRPDFTKQVVEGDPHQYNADVVGITRPQAKTLIYAITYGAGDVKIARTLGLPVLIRNTKQGPVEYSPEGKKIKEMFLERLGLKELIEQCQEEQANGRVELIDGSKIVCPSPHAALNYKLQGSGARVMGLSAVLADREIVRNGWDVLKVGDIHDEDQSDCAIDIADDFGRMRVDSIRQSGELLNMNVPLGGEYKKGLTWACTH